MTESDITPEEERHAEDKKECDDPDNYLIDRAQRRYEDWMLGDK